MAAIWAKEVGPVTKRPPHEDITSNWIIAPSGKAVDLTAIARAIEVVREAHPYVG